ncbi:MAG: 6-carboxytetrahydropterin synthase [Holophagaceae bacterium]
MPLLLTRTRPFVADHFHDLPGFQEDRHGHNWEARATLDTGEGDPEEVARRFEEALDAWIASVDYTLLNEQARLAGRNPTAELVAQWAFEALLRAGLAPVDVRIREKANYWARCRAEAAS